MASSSSASNDPSSFLTPPNQLVKIVNTGRSDLNGQFGQVLSYNNERNRYTIALAPPPALSTASSSTTTTALSFKPENLSRLSFLEKLQFKANTLQRRINLASHDPHLRAAGRQAYATLQSRLPPPLQPEYLLYAILFLGFVAVRYFGFLKTCLFVSLALTPVIVAAPDLVEGAGAGGGDLTDRVVRNFPMRVRDNMVAMTGYRGLSTRVALGIFAFFVIMAGKVLLTPAGVVKTTAAASATMTMDSRMESAYKLGYDDGKAGKSYGASLPDSMPQKIHDTTMDDSDMEDIDWAYVPPPSPPQSSSRGFLANLGIGKMMSLFALFRSLRDLAMAPDGTLSLDNLTLNLRRLEPWKLGMLLFCLYNVTRGFF